MTTIANPIQIKTRSTDGRTIRIEFGTFTLSMEEAYAFAHALSHETAMTENLPERHQNRHVNLLARCPLCVYEAGAQTDRLDWEPEDRLDANGAVWSADA